MSLWVWMIGAMFCVGVVSDDGDRRWLMKVWFIVVSCRVLVCCVAAVYTRVMLHHCRMHCSGLLGSSESKRKRCPSVATVTGIDGFVQFKNIIDILQVNRMLRPKVEEQCSLQSAY